MDNPSAFPQPYERSGDGMTLRDWFAGQALAGTFMPGTGKAILALSIEQSRHTDELRATYCYEVADAMLAARTNGGQSNG